MRCPTSALYDSTSQVLFALIQQLHHVILRRKALNCLYVRAPQNFAYKSQKFHFIHYYLKNPRQSFLFELPS